MVRSRTATIITTTMKNMNFYFPVNMPARIHRCTTCKVLFPTINALNDHCNQTSHMPSLQNHIKSNICGHPKADGKPPTRAVVAQMDGNAKKDGVAENDANGWGSPGDVSERDTQIGGRGPMKCPSAASNNISKPLPSVSELSTLPCAGSSPSKSDEATARARAALQSRFQVLGVSKVNEATDLLKSDICRTGKAEPSPVLDGSCSIAAKLSPNSTNKSKLPLNSLTNTTHPFACPGCRKEFKLFSGFVSHIENRACKSSMCHEIEDKMSICATQFFDTFTS